MTYKHLDTYPEFITKNIIQHCIISRYTEYIPMTYESYVENVYLVLHDLAPVGAVIPRHDKLKKIFCLTEWHVENFTEYFDLLKDITVPFYYGVDTDKFKIDDEDDLDDVSVVNGEGLFALNTLSFQAIGSVSLAILEFYASAGYGRGGSRLELNGDYTLTYDLEDGNGVPLGQINETITNPLQFKADVNSPRFGLGMRVNLAIFKLFAS